MDFFRQRLSSFLDKPSRRASMNTSLDVIRGSIINFTKSMYAMIKDKEGNVLISPLCIQMVLGMAHAAADGETERQIRLGATFPLEIDELHLGLQKLLEELELHHITFLMSHTMFLQNDINVKKSYNDVVKRVFQSEIHRVDFKSDSDNINKWLEEKMGGHLEHVDNTGYITKDTKCLLLSAIYFKDSWLESFQERRVYPDKFYIDNTTVQETNFVSVLATLRICFHQGFNATVIEVPYTGNEVSMLYILPNKVEGLMEVEDKLLSSQLLPSLHWNLTPNHVQFSMPITNLHFECDLKNVLKQLGMKNMFDVQLADFNKLSDEAVNVSSSFYKAFVQFEEINTSASAMEQSRRSLIDVLQIKLDHPFMFLLLHNTTSIPFIFGRVVKL